MGRVIDPGLEELSATLHRTGELARHPISAALLESLEGGEAYKEVPDIADALVAMDDHMRDEAVKLMARYQPLATDLLKISHDNSLRPGPLREIRLRHLYPT